MLAGSHIEELPRLTKPSVPCMNSAGWLMIEQVLKQANMYVWAKDKSYRYIFCSEKYAEAAGIDSPAQIIGKSDDQLPWRKLNTYI